MPVRGVGPGPGRRARATFRRRGQRRQSTTAPKHTGRARAESLGGRQLLLRRIVSLEDRRQRGAGPRPRPRRRLAAPRTRPPLRTLRTGNKGSERASGLPERAQRLGRGASSGGGSAPGQGLRRPCPRSGGSGQQLSPPATPPVEPLRSAQLGNGHLVCCCVRYLPENGKKSHPFPAPKRTPWRPRPLGACGARRSRAKGQTPRVRPKLSTHPTAPPPSVFFSFLEMFSRKKIK